MLSGVALTCEPLWTVLQRDHTVNSAGHHLVLAQHDQSWIGDCGRPLPASSSPGHAPDDQPNARGIAERHRRPRAPEFISGKNKASTFGTPYSPAVLKRAMLQYPSFGLSRRASARSATAVAKSPLRAWAEDK